MLFSVLNWLRPESFDNINPLISNQLDFSRSNLMSIAVRRMDVINSALINIKIDDKPVNAAQRVASDGLFDLHGVKCASDGYWMFIRPDSFENGEHRVSTYGTCNSGVTQISMDYTLEIV